jgi:hypothetical protein
VSTPCQGVCHDMYLADVRQLDGNGTRKESLVGLIAPLPPSTRIPSGTLVGLIASGP